MLFRYENKVYIKPFADKLVEVKVTKRGNEYNIEPSNKKIIITSKIAGELYSIPIEEAYKMQNKIK